ncbi:hypothetical protein [Nocardia sp. NPDC003963]
MSKQPIALNRVLWHDDPCTDLQPLERITASALDRDLVAPAPLGPVPEIPSVQERLR